ncbi:MAG: SMI1/KNR4 family protein [Pseudomonadota bacterium]|nr:SMI1/KNR4 family protein [Pseudomonadota bacterium]
MRKLLLLPIIIVGVIIMLPYVVWQQLQMTKPFSNYRKRHRKPPAPLTEAEIGKAEKQLGFALPEDLKQFYLSGGHRRRAACGEYYSLKGLVDEYRMLTRKPYGPNGEDWPANLLPFEDQLESYAAYDLETGLITIWDSEEIIAGNESRAAWKRTFQPTGKTLAEYLAK